jgi:hypothetical protein
VKGKGIAARKILQKMMRLRVEEETARNAIGGSNSGLGSMGIDSSNSVSQRREIDTLVM